MMKSPLKIFYNQLITSEFSFAASIISLPTTNPVPQSNLQTSRTVNSNTAPYVTQAQNVAPVLSTVANTVATSTFSSVATTPVTPPSDTKTLLICNKPSAVKIIPRFITDTATSTFRILPQIGFEQPKIIIDARSSASSSSSSEGHPANRTLQVTSQSCLTSENQDHPKLDNYIHTSITPTKESSADDSQNAKRSLKNVIFTDHSYTFEMKKKSTPCAKPVDDFKEDSAPANGSTYHNLLNEVLDWGLVEEVVCTSDAVLGAKSGELSRAGSHLVEEDDDSDSSELTDDSDMYNDTDFSESSGDEDLCVTVRIEAIKIFSFFHSESPTSNLSYHFCIQKKQDSEVQAQKYEDDELVDIETFDEGAEKSSVLPEQMKHDR